MKTALFLTALAGNAMADSTINKVVELLGELKGKVQNELAKEESLMEEYTEYCRATSQDNKHNIESNAKEIERASAIIEGAAAEIANAVADIKKSGDAAAEYEANISTAKKERAASKKVFGASEKELTEAVDTLGRAASVLKRELSFAQGASAGSMKKKLGNVVSALALIVNSSQFSSKHQKALKSFIEADDEDLSFAQQPQASTSNYDSKSGGIVDAIVNMKDEAEGNLQNLRREEMKAAHAHAMLVQDLENSLKTAKEQNKAANTSKQAESQKKAAAEAAKAGAEEDKAATEAAHATLTQECQAKAQEWGARQKSAKGEMAALEKAKEILTSGVKVMLVQQSTKTEKRSFDRNDEVRDELVSALRKLSRNSHSFGLMQLAAAAASDPFGKVRGLIESMLTKLAKQAKEEASFEAQCQEDLKKTTAKKEAYEADSDKYQTRKDKSTADKENAEQEIAELESELQEMASSQAEATNLRNEESADYKKASKDQKDSIAAVQQAIQVLQDFYGKAALLQQPEFDGAKNDSSSGIVSFLEVALADFQNLLAETETSETKSKNAYEKQTQANAVSKAEKEARVNGLHQKVKTLESSLEDIQSDLTTANTSLDLSMEELAAFRAKCTSKAMTYAERKAARDAEIAGLKDALEILSGDQATMFMQKRKVSSSQTFLGFSL